MSAFSFWGENESTRRALCLVKQHFPGSNFAGHLEFYLEVDTRGFYFVNKKSSSLHKMLVFGVTGMKRISMFILLIIYSTVNTSNGGNMKMLGIETSIFNLPHRLFDANMFLFNTFCP